MARHLLLGCLLLIFAIPVAAQQPATCSYLGCGLLRVDADILAGQQRTEVASFGALSPPDLRTLFQPSDSALHQLGTLLGRMDLPDGVEMLDIGPDWVLTRVRDELDLERVVLYGLERPGRAAGSMETR